MKANLAKIAIYMTMCALAVLGTDQISYRAGRLTEKRIHEKEHEEKQTQVVNLKKEIDRDQEILDRFTKRVKEIRELQKNAQR